MKRRALLLLTCLSLWTACFALVQADEARPTLLLFEDEEREKFGFKDPSGRVVIKPIYDDAKPFSEGRAAVNVGAKLERGGPAPMRVGGKWGYIDGAGKVVVPLTHDWADRFSEGLAQVGDDLERRFIDTEGRTAFSLPQGVSHTGRFKQGLLAVYTDRSVKKQDWLTRYVNQKGTTVFKIDGSAGEFHEGLTVLAIRDAAKPNQSKCGYIDLTGKVVVAPQFAEAYEFSEGLAAVRKLKTNGFYGKGDSWGYIDRAGRYVIETKFNEAGPFRDGTASVHTGGKLIEYDHAPPEWEGGEWKLIDRTGKLVKRQ